MTSDQIASQYEILSPQPGRASLTHNGLFWDVTITQGTQTIYGLAMIVGHRLAITLGPKDKMEIGAYQIAGETASSLWVPPAAKGESLSICGHEKLARENATTWRIQEAVAIDGSTYSGTIEVKSITPAQDTVPGIVGMTWTLNDGVFTSFGLEYDDSLLSTFRIGEKAPFGIMGLEGSADVLTTATIWEGDTRVTSGEWKAI